MLTRKILMMMHDFKKLSSLIDEYRKKLVAFSAYNIALSCIILCLCIGLQVYLWQVKSNKLAAMNFLIMLANLCAIMLFSMCFYTVHNHLKSGENQTYESVE